MTERPPVRLRKWPFFLGDALLLAVAAHFVFRTPSPLTPTQNFLCVLSVALGAFFSVWPFVAEYRTALKTSEQDNLAGTIEKIQNLESVAAQIAAATAQWQGVHEHSTKTVVSAREIAQKMSTETRAFTEFLQKANDTEKTHLRLEVEKLRRGEAEWLQIMVRLMDHIYALYVAAVRSGQKHIVEQIDSFQNACRDVARRVGLTPFVAQTGEPFDAAKHQLGDPNSKVPDHAVIAETLATGYMFQGQLVRPPIVAVEAPGNSGEPSADASEPVAEAPAHQELPL